MDCNVDGKEFININKATEYAKTKSWTVEEGVRLTIRTKCEPHNVLFPYDYELRVFHDGERVYFDDPERPNGYKKDETL